MTGRSARFLLLTLTLPAAMTAGALTSDSPGTCHSARHLFLAILPGTEGDKDTSDYRSVGRVSSASGVLVGPNLVLTAKHVGVGNIYLPGYGYFAPSDPGVAHPDADLLLYRIDTRGMDLPFSAVMADPVTPGSTITMLGYGLSGMLNDAGTGYDLNLPRGIRRKADAIMDRIEFRTYNGFQPGYSLISILRQNGQGALANGDSGGGIFQTIDGTPYLVGINSFIDVWGNGRAYEFSSSDRNYFASGAVSLSNYSDWLRANGAIVVSVGPEKYSPTAAQTVKGNHLLGDLDSFKADDNVYWIQGSGYDPTDPLAVINSTLYADTHVAGDSYAAGRVKVIEKCNVSLASVKYRLRAARAEGGWSIVIDGVQASTTETIIDEALPDPVGQFIDPGKKMRLEIRAASSNRLTFFQHYVDLAQWSLTR